MGERVTALRASGAAHSRFRSDTSASGPASPRLPADCRANDRQVKSRRHPPPAPPLGSDSVPYCGSSNSLSRENFLSLWWERLAHKRSTTRFKPFLLFLIGNLLGDDLQRKPLRPTDHFERRHLPYPLFGQQLVQIINAGHRPTG